MFKSGISNALALNIYFREWSYNC